MRAFCIYVCVQERACARCVCGSGEQVVLYIVPDRRWRFDKMVIFCWDKRRMIFFGQSLHNLPKVNFVNDAYANAPTCGGSESRNVYTSLHVCPKQPRDCFGPGGFSCSARGIQTSFCISSSNFQGEGSLGIGFSFLWWLSKFEATKFQRSAQLKWERTGGLQTRKKKTGTKSNNHKNVKIVLGPGCYKISKT